MRIIGGFAAANIAVMLIGAEGLNRQVLLLYGCLPAGVVNFVLTEKYRQDPELAACIVVLSNVHVRGDHPHRVLADSLRPMGVQLEFRIAG